MALSSRKAKKSAVNERRVEFGTRIPRARARTDDKIYTIGTAKGVPMVVELIHLEDGSCDVGFALCHVEHCVSCFVIA